MYMYICIYIEYSHIYIYICETSIYILYYTIVYLTLYIQVLVNRYTKSAKILTDSNKLLLSFCLLHFFMFHLPLHICSGGADWNIMVPHVSLWEKFKSVACGRSAFSHRLCWGKIFAWKKKFFPLEIKFFSLQIYILQQKLKGKSVLEIFLRCKIKKLQTLEKKNFDL